MRHKTVTIVAALAVSVVEAVAQPVTAPADPKAGSQCASPVCPKSSDDQLTTVSKKCALVAVMAMDNDKGPKEVAQLYVASMMDICVAHAMPSSWAGAPELLKKGQEFYQQAHDKNPDLVDPENLADTFEKLRGQSQNQ